jgi:flagellar biosynthesis protein FlhB
MSDASSEDKTQQPSRRRLEKARQEGQVARSPSLPGAAIVLTAAVFFTLAGGSMMATLEHTLSAGLRLDPETMRDSSRIWASIWHEVAPALEMTGALMVLLMVVGILANLAMGGWVFSAIPLTPNISRISPTKGLQRLFSRDGLVEVAKVVAKVAVLGAVTYFLLRDFSPSLLDLGRETWPEPAYRIAALSARSLLILASALAATVALEIPYQLWSHHDRLKMTRQELRDEAREMEVSPHTRRRLRALRRRFARMRMMSEIPRADVVVTNPDHYAAALRYLEGRMRAPRLVAKGTGLVALRIRELAVEHKIPIVEAPPLARAIWRYVELDEEIPVGLYQAVAEVLAYVYRLKMARDTGRPEPTMPGDGRFDPPEQYRAPPPQSV